MSGLDPWESVKTPYGAGAKQLANPVPAAQPPAVAPNVSDAPPAGISASTPAVSQPDASQAVDQASAASTQAPAASAAPQLDPWETAPAAQPESDSVDVTKDPGFATMLAQVKMYNPGMPEAMAVEQAKAALVPANASSLAEVKTHAKASFAMTDKEKMQVLSQQYGDENVRKSGSEFEVKRPGDKGKWTKFDQGGLSLLANWTRAAAEGVTTLPFEVGGAALGTFLSPGAGNAVGLGAGRAVGGAAATYLADQFAENVLGIKQDASRNKALEAGLSATVNTVFGAASDKVLGYAASKIASNQLAKTPWETMLASNKSLADGAEALSHAGVLKVLPGGEVALFPHQVDPSNPAIMKAFKEVSDNPAVQGILNRQAENARDAVINTLTTAAGVTGKHAPVEELAAQAGEVVRNVTKREGIEMGKWSLQASQKLGGAPVPLTPEVNQTATQLMAQLGFTMKAGGRVVAEDGSTKMIPARMVMSDPNTLVGMLGIQTPTEVKFYQKSIENLMDKINKGGLTLPQYSEAIEMMKPFLDKANRKGGQISALVNQLQSGLRTARRAAIESGLPDQAVKDAFNETMDKLGSVLGARDSLGKALNDDLTNTAFMKRVIDTKDTSTMLAAKGLFEKESPEVWNGIKKQYLDQMLARSEDLGSRTRLDTGAIRKQLFDPAQKEVREAIFDKADHAAMNQLLTIVDRIERTDLNAVPKDRAKMLVTGVLDVASSKPWLMARGFSYIGNLLHDREGAFLKTMTQDGFNSYLKRVPPGSRDEVRSALSQWVSRYNQSATGQAVNATAQAGASAAGKTMRMNSAIKAGQVLNSPNESAPQ